jgi:hypothetical protein
MPHFRISVERNNEEATRICPGNGHLFPHQLNQQRDNPFNDEMFLNISLNMLARYEALNLTAKEAIESTLVSPEDRSAYYQALSFRLAHITGLRENSLTSVILRIDEEFGVELKAMVTALAGNKPKPIQAPMTPCNARNPGRLTRFLIPLKGAQKVQRCFFPENDGRTSRSVMNSKKVRNIDWHLATAVQQVVSLSLDGSQPEKRGLACYKPPSPMHYQTAEASSVYRNGDGALGNSLNRHA